MVEFGISNKCAKWINKKRIPHQQPVGTGLAWVSFPYAWEMICSASS